VSLKGESSRLTVANTDEKLLCKRKLVDCCKKPGWGAFELLNIWPGEDVSQKFVFTAIVRLEEAFSLLLE
jgi:hypothetical protein